jgi:hypothetical protein
VTGRNGLGARSESALGRCDTRAPLELLVERPSVARLLSGNDSGVR